MKRYALAAFFWFAIAESCAIAQTHLNTLETVLVGIPPADPLPFIQGRAQQGITSNGEAFFTSSGNTVGGINLAPQRLYRYDQNWNLLAEQDVNYDPLIAHVGGITADSSYVYAATSDFTGSSSFYSIGQYSSSDLSFVDKWDIPFPFDSDGDFAGIDAYHSSLYGIEYKTNGVARIVQFDISVPGNVSVGDVFEISSLYANGIEFYGNYVYVSRGKKFEPGYIDLTFRTSPRASFSFSNSAHCHLIYSK